MIQQRKIKIDSDCFVWPSVTLILRTNWVAMEIPSVWDFVLAASMQYFLHPSPHPPPLPTHSQTRI